MAVCSSDLGPSTTEFITANNLTRFGTILSLIVSNISPTKWSIILSGLSFSDGVREGLLDALTADLERGKAGN